MSDVLRALRRIVYEYGQRPGQTEGQIAHAAGMTHSAMSRALSGGRPERDAAPGHNPRLDTAERIARAVGCRFMVIPEALVPQVEALLARHAAEAVTLDSPVGDLYLTARAERLLIGAGIATVRDLAARMAPDLLKIKGFGAGCLREVEAALAGHGLRLAEVRPCRLCRGSGTATAVDAVEADGRLVGPRPAPCMICAPAGGAR